MNERELTVRVADITFGIRCRYDVLPLICEDYILEDGTPDFWLSATDEEIAVEQEKADEPIGEGLAESSAIHRKLGEKLLAYDAFLFHAAVIEYEGVGYAFSAQSGVGKTTHIRLWREHFGDGVRIINGDKPIVRFVDGKVYAYGTPWCGKERYNINDKCELRNVCFIERDAENSLATLQNKDALLRLFPQVMLHRSGKDNLTVLALLDRFFERESFYLLRCNPTRQAAEVAYHGMNVERKAKV